MRYVNRAGLELIRAEEGLRLDSYLCRAGRWTIGWGHTGPEVKRGQVITQLEAERLFALDIQKHSMGLEKFVKVATTPNQWAALVSLAFNFGVQAIGTSTLVKLLNAGDVVRYDAQRNVVGGAAHQFLRWKYLDDNPDPEIRHMVEDAGLLRRRHKEMALFLTPELVA